MIGTGILVMLAFCVWILTFFFGVLVVGGNRLWECLSFGAGFCIAVLVCISFFYFVINQQQFHMLGHSYICSEFVEE